MNHTSIEWTDATWNPTTGCTKVSPGCKYCYAKRLWPRVYPGRDFEDVQMHDDRLAQPLRWKRPRMIFVNSMSDLFHEDIDEIFLKRVFAVMALAPRHTFQVLTKRADRMREWVGAGGRAAEVFDYARHSEFGYWADVDKMPPLSWPLPNVWLGVSVEDQVRADARIPHLLRTPATVRFLSCEPLLGPVDITPWLWGRDKPCAGCPKDADCTCGYETRASFGENALHWVIAGGESGPGARPSRPDWFRSLRDQCAAAGVAYFFKQWGEWAPQFTPEGMVISEHHMVRVGKKTAGRVLDGVTHDAYPA